MTDTANQIFHPELDEFGNRVLISTPSISSDLGAWLCPNGIATYSVSDTKVLPKCINGIELEVCDKTPNWKALRNVMNVQEPPAPSHLGLLMTSGCVVVEPDNRVWLAQPTNRFCSLLTTFPKGRLEPELDLITNAMKETFEETGLFVHPVSFLCDIHRTKSVTRYYVAHRIAGSPKAMGWETQAVSLVPIALLKWVLNAPNDRKVIEAIRNWMSKHN